MKLASLAVVLLCTTAAFGQYSGSVLNNQPVITEFASHVEHASVQSLATPQYILGNSASISARGVTPLWEFPVTSEEVSLGEVARQLRKQHELAKKAQKVMSDQK